MVEENKRWLTDPHRKILRKHRLEALKRETGPIRPVVDQKHTPMPPVSKDFDVSKLDTMHVQAVRPPTPKPITHPSMPALPAIQQASPVRRPVWRYEDKNADPPQLLDDAISKFAREYGILPKPIYTAEWNFIWLQVGNKLHFVSDERGVYTHELGDVLIAMDPGAEPCQVTAPAPTSDHK